MRNELERLQDILDAISAIESELLQGYNVFEIDRKSQVWVVHHLQIIGEASRSLSDAFRNFNPQIPWPQIIGMRNIFVHAYFKINVKVVWDTAQNDLPELKNKVQAILQNMTGTP